METAKILLCVLQDKGSFSRLLVAGFSRTDAKLSFSRWIGRGKEMHLLWLMLTRLLSFKKHSPMSVLTTWEFNEQMIRPCLSVHCSSTYWCPSSLCMINFFLVLGHQSEILFRSRECKTGSVEYCNQVEEQLKCLGKALQMVMKKRWPPVEMLHKLLEGSSMAASWEGNVKKKEEPIFPSR